MPLRSHPKVTVHEEHRLHEGNRISLIRQRCELPSGLELDIDLVEHPGAVAIAALNEKGQLLVVRQYRPAIGDCTREIPAGALDAGEEPADAAAREFEEETGLRATRLEHLNSIALAPGFASEVLHLYHAVEYGPAPAGGATADEDEELDVQWISPAELLAGQPVDAKTLVACLLAPGLSGR